MSCCENKYELFEIYDFSIVRFFDFVDFRLFDVSLGHPDRPPGLKKALTDLIKCFKKASIILQLMTAHNNSVYKLVQANTSSRLCVWPQESNRDTTGKSATGSRVTGSNREPGRKCNREPGGSLSREPY